jgi:uncharacterized membrane protein YwzB
MSDLRLLVLNPVSLVGFSILVWGALRSFNRRWDEHAHATNSKVIFAFISIFLAMGLTAFMVGACLFALLYMAAKANHPDIGEAALLIFLGPSFCLVLGAIASWILGPRIGRMVWRSHPTSDD